MTPGGFVLQDGGVVPAPAEALGGLAHGYGVFETVRAYDGRLFELAAHLERMRQGADRLGIKTPPLREVEPGCQAALAATGLRDARVRITCVARSAGSALWTAFTQLVPSELFIQAEPVDPALAEIRRRGVSVVTSSHRVHEGSIVAGVKTIGYAGHILAKREATKAGAYEAIILNCRGDIVEGSMSNVFMVSDGRVATPSLECGPLAGVTRQAVLELAPEAGLPVDEMRCSPAAMAEADECFLTSSVAEIVPVVMIDQRPVGNGKPGDITIRLQHDYAERILGE